MTKAKILSKLALVMPLGTLLLASCSETIDTAQERRSSNEKAFLAYADSTSFTKVSLPGTYGDRYVYMKWSKQASDRTQKPKATDYIRMHYTGTFLTNGYEFDSNLNVAANLIEPMIIKRGSSGLVAGMVIALQNMAIGDKASIIIPWYLGYGETGSGIGYTTIIPSYSALRFEVELVDVLGDNS